MIEYVCFGCSGLRVAIEWWHGVEAPDDIECPRCHQRAVRTRPLREVVADAEHLIDDMSQVLRDLSQKEDDLMGRLSQDGFRWLAEAK